MAAHLRFALVSALFSLLACGSDDPGLGGACETAADCDGDQLCVDGRCAPRSSVPDAGEGDMNRTPVPIATSLAIQPAAPSLVVTGAPASITLMGEVTYDDGSTAVATGFWSIDSARLGTIDATSGEFTATGDLSGTVEVSLEAMGLMATETLTITVERTVIVEGAPADSAARFDAAPVATVDVAAREAGLLYPLDAALFPKNVYAADLQWERGVEGDLYRVRMQIPGVSATAYLAHTGAAFGYDWPVAGDIWRALAEAAPETSVSLTVDRLEAASGEVVPGTVRSFRFADASIRGSLYYWDLANGRIQRIRGDGTGLEAFMPSPPARPSDGSRCVACHTVSRDGTRMAAEMWSGGGPGAIFDLTADLSGDPAPTVVAPGITAFLTASFSPDNDRLVANAGNELFLMDGNTGARLPAGGAGLPATGSAHPTWSPDGTQIAYAMNTNGSWGVDFTAADLGIIDVTGADTFAAPRVIHPGAGRVVARPTWSPDSNLLAIQYGTNSRIDNGGTAYPGTVRLVSRDGVNVWNLETLNAGVENNYDPNFSPFDEGGYFWLAFVSTRDYGNAQSGTRGSGRRQLWVAAVSNAATPGADPSFVPYWLPQQNRLEQNMAAYWTMEPCRSEGLTCATSDDCCSGFCRDTGAGPVCVPPDEVECSERGEACGSDSDCCEGAGTCIANVCSDLG
ncbi:MAG: hypothetical protein CMN30_24125 [Sandaracinus sp.]|nr:hypothetical protein [Sandaracinus sp.]